MKPIKATCQCGNTFMYDGTNSCTACKPKDGDNITTTSAKKYSNHKRGPRTINGETINFANAMEANYYRYLLYLREQGLIKGFVFQPKALDFTPHGIKHGTTQYRPDFLVTDLSGETYYVETKGHFTAKDKTKLKRARELCKVRVDLVMYRQFKELEKQVGGLVPNWEY